MRGRTLSKSHFRKITFLNSENNGSLAFPPYPGLVRPRTEIRAIPVPNSQILTALAYLGVSIALRSLTFGNPVVHIDEQFYLLVGDRMLHGALPYIDIWDRKPFGLFLIFAAIRKLGGDGIVEYQIVASLFAGATAMVINRLARCIAPAVGAFWAGIAYLLYLLVANCAGGQTPVFYNLFVALAALTTFKAIRFRNYPALAFAGAFPMLLAGIAIQIKYTALFEGIGLGLALMWRARADGLPIRRIAGLSLLWIACALAPTLLAYGYYVSIGHGDIFLSSNFMSIFGRRDPLLPALGRLVIETLALTPFWLTIFHARRRLQRVTGAAPEAMVLLAWWATCAIIGFLLFGTYFDHYTAPLLPPLTVLAAPGLGRPGAGRQYTTWLIGLGLVAGIGEVVVNRLSRGNRAEVEKMTSLIQSRLGTGCLYVYEGDPILYKTTGACLATRYIFPSHLDTTVEAKAIGVDPVREVERIMATKPAVVVLGQSPIWVHPNLETRRVVETALGRGYRCDTTAWVGQSEYKICDRRMIAG